MKTRSSHSDPLIKLISPKDAMFNAIPDTEAYMRAGLSVAEVIKAAADIHSSNPKSILDYGCGHGRILRWLQTFFPDASLTAADVTNDQVNFCAEAFGATPFVLRSTFSEIQLPSQYDLIWLGSIFTHLDETSWAALAELMQRHMAPNGLLCFSFAGSAVYRLLKSGDRWGLKEEDEPVLREMIASYEREGFGFMRQWDSNDAPWGRSIARSDWVLEFLSRRSGRIVLFSEAAYAKRQDVVCVTFPG